MRQLFSTADSGFDPGFCDTFRMTRGCLRTVAGRLGTPQGAPPARRSMSGVSGWRRARVVAFAGGVLARPAGAESLPVLPEPVPMPAGEGEPEAAEPTAEVLLAGELGRSRELRELLTELLASHQVEPHFRRVSRITEKELLSDRAGEGHRVRIGLSLRNKTLVRLYLADAHLGRYLVRDVPLSNGLDEVGREGVAQVVGSTTRALLENDAAMTRDEMQRALRRDLDADNPEKPSPPPPIPPKSAPPSEPARGERWRLELGVGYATEWSGPDLGLLHGPGVRLGVGHGGEASGVFGVVHVMQGFEQEHEAAELLVQVRTTSARLLLGAELGMAPTSALSVAFGAGFDAQRVTPRAVPGGLPDIAPEQTHTTPWLSLELGPRWVVSPLVLSLLGVVDVGLQDTHYDVRGLQQDDELFVPWRIRPGLVFGVAWQSATEPTRRPPP